MNQKPDQSSPILPAAQCGNMCQSRDGSADSPGSPGSADDAGGEPPPERPAGALDLCCVELNLLADDTDPPLAGWLDVHLAKIAAIERVTAGYLSVAVVDDSQMAQMHRQYKQLDGTTDVLAFDMRQDEADPIEADLVICRDEAARQAASRGHAVRLELLLYAVHGLLHLLGYDDGEPDDAAVMHQREDELLTAIGLEAAFARRSSSDECQD